MQTNSDDLDKKGIEPANKENQQKFGETLAVQKLSYDGNGDKDTSLPDDNEDENAEIKELVDSMSFYLRILFNIILK